MTIAIVLGVLIVLAFLVGTIGFRGRNNTLMDVGYSTGCVLFVAMFALFFLEVVA